MVPDSEDSTQLYPLVGRHPIARLEGILAGSAAAELILRAMTELCYSHRRTRTTNDDDVGVNISRGSRIARYDLLHPAAAE